MIVEFSVNDGEKNLRLFYGLNKKGRYYFPGEPVYKEIRISNCVDCDDEDLKGRYESRNLLVHLKDDTNREKEYMFSMSSYYSLAELIDIDDRDNFKLFTWNMTKFIDITRPIFSYEYSLFEIDNDKTYIAAFIESAGFKADPDDNNKLKEYSETITLKKFRFDSFNNENYRTILKTNTTKNTFDGRVVSAFRLDESKLIAVMIVFWDSKYRALFFDDDLAYKGECSIYNDVKNLWKGFGIFFKGISVKGDHAALALYYDGNSKYSLVFKFMKFKLENNVYDFEILHSRNFDSNDFYCELHQDIQTNGLYKLDDNRLVLFAPENLGSDDNKIESRTMHMFLFDLYNNYAGLKVREYKFVYPEKRFAKEIDASLYNGYIVFTSTISNKDQSDMFAIMMIFGFANGTDHTIDISPYLMDTGSYDSSNNLYDYLMTKMSIDNNIFGYEKIEGIRLISICDELKLYKDNQASTTLPLNDVFDANLRLEQNKNIKKEEDKLYTLEYQFMVKEPTYENLYSSATNVWDSLNNKNNEKDYYTRNILMVE